MIVKCIHNSGADLGPPTKGSFYTSQSVFHLYIGVEYEVFGLGIFWASLLALVCDETGMPSWQPVSLFEIDPQTLPPKWEFAVKSPAVAEGDETPDRWVALWGYPELVRNASHNTGLLERDRGALDLFFHEVAKRAMTRGLQSKLLKLGQDDVLQLSEVISGLGAFLSKDPHDSSLMWPTSKAVEQMLESGYVIAGDVKGHDDGSLSVLPWELSPAEVGRRIERVWQSLDEPRNLNDIVWLELTDAGLDEARRLS